MRECPPPAAHTPAWARAPPRAEINSAARCFSTRAGGARADESQAEREGSSGDPLIEVQDEGEEVAVKERTPVGEEVGEGEKEESAGVPLAALDLEEFPLKVALGED